MKRTLFFAVIIFFITFSCKEKVGSEKSVPTEKPSVAEIELGMMIGNEGKDTLYFWAKAGTMILAFKPFIEIGLDSSQHLAALDKLTNAGIRNEEWETIKGQQLFSSSIIKGRIPIYFRQTGRQDLFLILRVDMSDESLVKHIQKKCGNERYYGTSYFDGQGRKVAIRISPATKEKYEQVKKELVKL